MHHLPVMDWTPLEPPPVVVATGPPRIGKCTLISSLVKTYSRQPLTDVKGSVTQWCQVGMHGECMQACSVVVGQGLCVCVCVMCVFVCVCAWACVCVCVCVCDVHVLMLCSCTVCWVWVVKVYMWIYSCESYGYMLCAIMYMSSVGAVGGTYF